MSIANLQPIKIGNPNNPANSDSLYTAFNTIQDNFEKVANQSSNITNVVGGTGINVATSNTNVVTVTNTGVTQIIAGTSISLSPANGTGVVTISSTGGGSGGGGTVTSVGVSSPNNTVVVGPSSPIIGAGTISVDLPPLNNLVAASYSLPNVTVDRYGRVTAISTPSSLPFVTRVNISNIGSGIEVDGSLPDTNGVQNIGIKNTGVLSITNGAGISVTGSNGAYTISATGSGGGGGGSVTSVGIESATFTVSPNPILTSGTLSVNLPTGWTFNTTSYNMGITGNFTARGVNATSLNGVLGENSNSQPNITTLGTLTSLTTETTTGNASIGGSLTVTGTTSFAGNVRAVGGTTTLNVLNANTANLGALNVSGPFTANLSGSGAALTNLNASNLSIGIVPNTVVSGNYMGITQVGALNGLSVTGNATVSGNSDVTGNANIGNIITTTITAANAIIGNLSLSNSLMIPGLSVMGNGSIGGNLTVGSNSSTGSATFTGDITANGNIQANGTITAAGNIIASANVNITSSLNVSANANIGGNLFVTSGANINGYVTVGNIQILATGTEARFGNSNVYANFIELGNGANFGGDLIEFTNTTDTTVSTTAPVLFMGGVRFQKNVFADGSLYVGGAAQDPNTYSLEVNGNVMANGGIWAKYDSNIDGNLNITGFVILSNPDPTANMSLGFVGYNANIVNINSNGRANLSGNTTIANANIAIANLANVTIANANIANITGTTNVANANIANANITIGRLNATVTANADSVSGNLVTIVINGTTYQLLAK